jgi:hypothetical protein
MSTSSGLAGTVFDLRSWDIPITVVAETIVAYVEDKNLYLEHLRRVPMAAGKFDPKNLLKSYEAVYLELYAKTSKNHRGLPA